MRKIPLAILFVLFLVTTACADSKSEQAPQAILFAAGDIARCYDNKPGEGAIATANLLDNLTKEYPQAQILALGDLAYMNGTEDQFNHCYNPTWGKYKDKTLPVPGNHEYYASEDFSKGQGIEPYNHYFQDRFATLSAESGNPQQGYYAVDVGAWRMVAINTEVIVDNRQTLEHYPKQRIEQIEDSALRTDLLQKLDREMDKVDQTYPIIAKAQQPWLEQEAFSGNHPCTLAFMHHPKYSSGFHGNRKAETEPLAPLYQLLHDKGVSLVLTGHDHQYERFAPLDGNGDVDTQNGLRPFMVGTGGAENYEYGETQNHSEVRNNRDWGVLKLELFEDSYAWQFIPVNGESMERHEEACVPR